MSEEGFHEIELKGKQLVFLFMAATVVSVVIFLCGVMVGRGVRPPAAAQAPDALLEETGDLTALAGGPSQGTALPVSAGEDLSADAILDTPDPVAEPLRAPAVEPASNVPPSPPEPKPAPVRAAVRESVPSGSTADQIYFVQVVATTTRKEAESVMKRLTQKGYRAFVTPVDAAAKSAYKFRVRVGKYTRREAETVAQRLTKEEQFKPWITR
jgi:cell division septation protein DedD